MPTFEHDVDALNLKPHHHPKVRELKKERREVKDRLETVEHELAALEEAETEAALTRELAREAAEKAIGDEAIDVVTYEDRRQELERQKRELTAALDGVDELIQEATTEAAEEMSKTLGEAVGERYKALLPLLKEAREIHEEIGELRKAWNRSRLDSRRPERRLEAPHKLRVIGKFSTRVNSFIDALEAHGY